MNILYVSSKDPRSTDGGNEQRTNHLWKALQKIGKVYTVVYVNSGYDTPFFESEQNPICFVPTHYKKYRKTVRGLGYSLFTKLLGWAYLPYKYPYDFYPTDLYENVKFDIVVSRYIYDTAKYHLWDIAPTFIDIDDDPIQVFNTLKKQELPQIIQPISLYFIRKQYENLKNKIQGGWIANKGQVSPNSKIHFLPNIPHLPSSNYCPEKEHDNYLFTIGVMSYSPNYKGVDRFLNEIWPAFHSRFPNVKYLIGGKGAPKDFADKWNSIEGVEYVGFINNLESAYESCIASVVPVYSGGGTCIKTIESLAYSRVCMSTKFGVRGIDKADEEYNGICLFYDIDSFCNSFDRICNNDYRRSLQNKARDFILREYSVDKFEKAVTQVLNDQAT